jgi:putative acetyltransferase
MILRETIFRPERPGEEQRVDDVVTDAFGGPDHGHAGAEVATLVDRLRESPDWIDGLSFVAEVDRQVVGHILFTRGLLDTWLRLVDILVLSPVSVATAFQGQGIGTGLISHGLERLTEGPYPLVFLEGDPRFYSRFGFIAGVRLGFRRPSLRIPEPGFQVLPLPGYEPWMSGTLVYSRVFWDLDLVGLRDQERFDRVG